MPKNSPHWVVALVPDSPPMVMPETFDTCEAARVGTKVRIAHDHIENYQLPHSAEYVTVTAVDSHHDSDSCPHSQPLPEHSGHWVVALVPDSPPMVVPQTFDTCRDAHLGMAVRIAFGSQDENYQLPHSAEFVTVTAAASNHDLDSCPCPEPHRGTPAEFARRIAPAISSFPPLKT